MDLLILKQIDLNSIGLELLIIEYNNNIGVKNEIIEYCKIFNIDNILLDNGINIVLYKN